MPGSLEACMIPRYKMRAKFPAIDFLVAPAVRERMHQDDEGCVPENPGGANGVT